LDAGRRTTDIPALPLRTQRETEPHQGARCASLYPARREGLEDNGGPDETRQSSIPPDLRIAGFPSPVCQSELLLGSLRIRHGVSDRDIGFSGGVRRRLADRSGLGAAVCCSPPPHAPTRAVPVMTTADRDTRMARARWNSGILGRAARNRVTASSYGDQLTASSCPDRSTDWPGVAGTPTGGVRPARRSGLANRHGAAIRHHSPKRYAEA
jgi:hypothetical protein